MYAIYLPHIFTYSEVVRGVHGIRSVQFPRPVRRVKQRPLPPRKHRGNVGRVTLDHSCTPMHTHDPAHPEAPDIKMTSNDLMKRPGLVD